jgi:hypothetical protein
LQRIEKENAMAEKFWTTQVGTQLPSNQKDARGVEGAPGGMCNLQHAAIISGGVAGAEAKHSRNWVQLWQVAMLWLIPLG